MAKLTCYGGAGSTTGANFLFELAGKKILIDCGMEQGGGGDEHNQKPFGYDPKSIDLLFVTHAHIDHVGLIPKLYRAGFRGAIYSTQETKEIARLLLLDAAKISSQKENPLYTLDDVEPALGLWQDLAYHQVRDFGGFTIELFDAGHVLGSAMIKLTSGSGKVMLFTGDLGNSPSPLLRDVEQVSGLDYLLIESVYGDRNHEERELRIAKFTQVLTDVIARKGTLLIPSFSLERTQEILSLIDDLFESKQIEAVPVFLDSPLAIKITEIYEKVTHLFNPAKQEELKQGDDIFKFPQLKITARYPESHVIHETPGPKIIIAGAGMSTGGRILGHEEKYLPDPNNTLLLMGFQAIGTLGRQIEEGAKQIMIDEKPVSINARIEKISGFSGHADSDALVNFVKENGKSLKKVLVAMGEPRSAIFLAQRLRDELGVDAVATEEGKSYEVEL